MTSVCDVLCATTAAAKDYTQETIRAAVEWNGRLILNGVKNALFVVGGIGGAVAVYEFANPFINTAIPGWLLGAVTGGSSLLAIAGGLCLYASSPPEFEDLVANLKNEIDRFKEEDKRFAINVGNYGGTVNRFENAVQKTEKIYGSMEETLHTTGTRLETTCNNLNEVKQSTQITVATTQQFGQQIDRLENLLSNNRQTDSNGHYILNIQEDHTIVDFNALLNAHEGLLNHQQRDEI